MSARRAAVRHSTDSFRDRSGSNLSQRGEGGSEKQDLMSNNPNMANSNHLHPPGITNGPIIQADDSEMSQERLTCSSTYSYTAPPQVENKMQRELKYFFMNPYEKYKARGRKPWKLCIQVLKIFLVTSQLITFGTNQFSVVTFMEENGKAFEHIFLRDWEATYDSGVYPSTKSLYALYETKEFFNHSDHVITQYADLNNGALGTYILPSEEDLYVLVKLEEYEMFDPTDENYYNLSLKTLTCEKKVNITSDMKQFRIQDFMDDQNCIINFNRLHKLTLNFKINSVHVKDTKTLSGPDCIVFNVTVTYDNTAHSGRIGVSLREDHKVDHKCTDQTRKHAHNTNSPLYRCGITIMDIIIIFLCMLSSILCSRSLYNGHKLKKKTFTYFKRYHHRQLSRSEKMMFLNLWYVVIIISDMLTIAGTITKILIQEQLWTDYDSVSLLLGAGCFLVWFGIIRYLGFFHSYSIPVITLKVAMPNVLRFLLCAAIMYLAYAFCGWVVLGPYHKKFRTLGITIECMYSLINGDDMFATFRAMSDTNHLIYYFSQIYLYSFISLFIYVVLSLFIAVIMDTYETVKEMRERDECENDLERFIKQCDESPDSGCFRIQNDNSTRSFFRRCCKRNNQPDEYSPLMD